MSLLRYIITRTEPAQVFDIREIAALRSWHADFGPDVAWQLIRRNIDRECERDDINHDLYASYLRAVARAFPLAPAPRNPVELMNDVCSRALAHYFMPGLPLNASATTLLMHCFRTDRFLKYNAAHLGLSPEMLNTQGFITLLRMKIITGDYLVDAAIGGPQKPVWVAHFDDLSDVLPTVDPESLEEWTEETPNRVRDFLGLQHVQSGTLTACVYDVQTLKLAGLQLKAPTVLDAALSGEENWVFVKHPGSGPVDWGRTVDLQHCTPGAREAVHARLPITTVTGPRIEIRYLGPLTKPPSPCSFQDIMENM